MAVVPHTSQCEVGNWKFETLPLILRKICIAFISVHVFFFFVWISNSWNSYFLFNSLVIDRQRRGDGQAVLVWAQRLGLRCAHSHCKNLQRIYCSKCVNVQVLQHIRITSSSKVAGKAVLGVSVTGRSSWALRSTSSLSSSSSQSSPNLMFYRRTSTAGLKGCRLEAVEATHRNLGWQGNVQHRTWNIKYFAFPKHSWSISIIPHTEQAPLHLVLDRQGQRPQQCVSPEGRHQTRGLACRSERHRLPGELISCDFAFILANDMRKHIKIHLRDK